MNEQLLKDYVATYMNPQYGGDWDVVNSKFPEFESVDKQLLKDYVATYLNPEYNGDWDTVNSKFPEFFGVKKKEPTPLPSSAGQLPSQKAERVVEAEMPEDKGFFSENSWNALKSASKNLFGQIVQFAGEGLISDPMARAGQYGIDSQKNLEKAREVRALKTQAIMGGEDVLPGASVRAYGKEVQEKAKEIQYDPNTLGAIVAQAVPSVAGTIIGTGLSLIPGGATVGVPLATVSSGLGVIGSIQDGRNTYTEYKKEKGLPINLEAREATGLAYGAFEMLSEKLQLDRVLPKGAGSQLARKLLGSVPEEVIERESADLVRNFAESSVSRSKMVGDLLGKMATEAPIEGISEGLTTVAQELASFAFYEEKDRKLDSDFWNEVKNSFIGGAVMGGGLGPLSYGAQRSTNNQRRKAAGEVVLVKNGKTGEGLEIIQDKGETISAVRPNGEVIEVQKSDLVGEPVRMSYDAFNNYLKGARSGAQVAMESENVPQVGESVSFFANRNQTAVVDKVDLASKTVDIKYGTGAVRTVTIDQFNELKSKAYTVESLSDGENDWDFMSKNDEFSSIDSFEDQATAQSVTALMSMRYPGIEFSITDNRPTPTSAPDFRIIGKTKPSAQAQQPTGTEPTGAQPTAPQAPQSQPVDQGPTTEVPVEAPAPPKIQDMAGRSVTVKIGKRNVSGIVEVDEGGKATITEGNKIYEIPEGSPFKEFTRPVSISPDGDFVVNGEAFTEARIVVENGQKKALMVRSDGTTKAITSPNLVEEIDYNITLASSTESGKTAIPKTELSESQGLEEARAIARQAKSRTVQQSIEKAAAVLKVSYPGVDMIVGEDDADTKAKMVEVLTQRVGAEKAKELADGMDTGGQAVFVDGKPVAVVINKSSANSTTAAHEVWHVVLRDAFGKNPAKFKQFKDEISRTLNKAGYGDISDSLDDFAAGYEGDITYEEYLAEFGGLLSSAGFDAKKLSPKEKGLLNQIKEIINKFSMDLVGKKVFLEDATPENIIQFMSAVSDMISRGEDVSAYIRAKGEGVVESGKDVKVDVAKQQQFNKGVEAVKKNAEEYKAKIGNKSRSNEGVPQLFGDVSRMMSKEYEKVKDAPNDPFVKASYDAMMREVVDQYDFIVSKGLKVVKHTGKGEPYANSTDMLKDLRENNTLKFLPNEVAFGQGDTDVTGNIGLEPSGRKLEDGYELTKSEAFRVVHDYFGHGILGNQFGPIGEENATLQHLDLFSNLAAPAVILQTRGQNSWVNFSGVNDEAAKLRSDARNLTKEGKTEEANALLKKAEEIFKFADPKIGVFDHKFNFKRYETARRLKEQEAVNSRADKRDNELSGTLERYSGESRRTRGVDKRDVRGAQRLGGVYVNTIAEYSFDDQINKGILAAFPEFKGVQKVYEVTDGAKYREMMISSLKDNRFASSVTIHSAEDFNQMRMFVTEDGSTGITITKEGFLGGAFSNPNAKRPNNLAQLMVLGVKEGATTAEAFDTVLPDYYSQFGFKAVSRTAFNDEYRPLIENGNTIADWDYDVYRKYNDGRPDVVFFIYDGGNRNTVEDRLGLFDTYSYYDKQFTKAFDKDGYMDAEAVMKQEAVKRLEHDAEMEVEVVKQIDVDNVRSKDRPGKRISKGLGTATVDKKKIATETEGLSIDYVKEKSPKIFISNAKILSEYPLISRELAGNPVETIEQAQEVYDLFVRRVADNLLYLVDEFNPEFREISTLWYDGANIMANDMAEKYGLKPEQVSGIMASLSPQKDWYQNVRLAELVLMAYDTNPVVTKEMIDYQRKISKTGIYDTDKSAGKKFKRAKAAYEASRTKANKLALDEAKVKLDKAIDTAEKLAQSLSKHVGKKLKDVPLHYQSYMVRTYHEVNTTKDYSIIRPDGQYGELAKKNNGQKAKVAWGSYTEIGKAVSIYNDGSQENITRSLGEKHKIRNFYNNIIDPMSQDGDVTIDTHAVAAALLMALSGKAKQVSQNFGTGTSNSGPLGIQGTYYAYSDAYALAAKEKGLLPRQIQSITWEAVRGLYTDTFKSSKQNVSGINQIWERYAKGEITIDEARNAAKERAGGIEDPTWAGGPIQEELGDGYESEVFSEGIDGDEQDALGDVEVVEQKPKKRNVLTENKGLSGKEKGKQGLEEILSAKEKLFLAKLRKAKAQAAKAAKAAREAKTEAAKTARETKAQAVKTAREDERTTQQARLKDFMDAKQAVVEGIQALMKQKFTVGGKEVSVPASTVGQVNKILNQVLKGKSLQGRYKIDPGGNRVPFMSTVDEAISTVMKMISDSVRKDSIDRARANRRVAKNNVKAGKLGVLPTGGSIDQLLQIDPSIVPLSVFDQYMEIINEIGQRKKVLALEDQGALSQKVQDILDKVDAENGLLEQLALAYDNHPKAMAKRKDPNTGQIVQYESYSKTIEDMLAKGVISTSDYDLMKRRKDAVVSKTPSQGKAPMTRQEADAVVSAAMSAKSSLPTAGAGFTSFQNSVIRIFSGLTKKDVEALVREVKDNKGNVIGYNTADVANLAKVMDNLSNGYITNLAQTMSEKIQATRKANKVAAVISKYKNNPLNWISSSKAAIKNFFNGKVKGTTTINEKIRRTGNYAIDVALNNFENSDVYNEILRPISVAIERKDKELQAITAEVVQIMESIPFKDQFEQNTLVRMIMLHKMKQSDPTMPSVKEWIEATKKGDSQYLDETMDKIQSMYDSVKDGDDLDLNKAMNKLSPKGKKLLDSIEKIQKDTLSPKVAFGATVIRGSRVPVLEYYAATPRVVNGKKDVVAEEGLIKNYTQPSSRASTFHEKTKVAHEISFDAVESVLWSARHTLTDFYLTPELRTAQATVKNIKRMDWKGQQKEAADALDLILSDSIEMVLGNQFGDKSTTEKITQGLVKKAYQSMLAGFIRPGIELVSNISYALIDGHSEFLSGMKVLSGKTKPGMMSDAVFNLGSSQLNRMFNLKGGASRYADASRSFSYDPMRDEITGMRKFAKVASSVGDSFDTFSNTTMSAPDQIVARTVFFGALSIRFKELTGKDVDLEKIADNDQAYMEANFEQLKLATEFADSRVAEGFSSASDFDGILRNKVTRSDKWYATAFKSFNGFMNKFLVSEYTTSVKAINAIIGNGAATRTQGAKMLVAQSARMMSYSYLMTLVNGYVYNKISELILDQLGVEPPEEEEEEVYDEEGNLLDTKDSYLNVLARETASVVAALAIDRNFGNIAKAFTSTGVEALNKGYGEGITYKGPYNQYEDNVSIPFFEVDKKAGGLSTFEQTLLKGSGAMSPYMRNVMDMMNHSDYARMSKSEKTQNKHKDAMVLSGIKMLALVTGVPLYRDFNKINQEVTYAIRQAEKNTTNIEEDE